MASRNSAKTPTTGNPEALPRYQEFTHCPKCGNDAIGSKYEQGEGQEWILRNCNRCGFSWKEGCLDQPD